MRNITLDDSKRLLQLHFEYDERLIAVVRELPERRYNVRGGIWQVPAVHAHRVCKLLTEEHGFQLAPEVAALVPALTGESEPPDATDGGSAGTAAGQAGTVGDDQKSAGSGARTQHTESSRQQSTARAQRNARSEPFPGRGARSERAPTRTPDVYPGRNSDHPNLGSQNTHSEDGSNQNAKRDALSIRRLNQLVLQALRQAFPREVWVVGELVGYDRGARGKGHYFDLADKPEQTWGGHRRQRVAKAPCVLWSREKDRIQRRLSKASEPFELEDGLVVCLKVQVDFWAASGRFQLKVVDIDPVYTLGDLAQKRERILKMLRAQGLADQNRSLPLPNAPLRVALLTSEAGEAARDFVHTLRGSGFGFDVTLFDVVVQGPRLSWSVCNALRHVTTVHNHRLAEGQPGFDVIVLIRGGGSRTDLGWFDDEKVALAVARHPLKVLVGIGHQRDQGVLDVIAESVKTPTAAASHLVDMTQSYLRTQHTLWEQIRNRASGILEGNRHLLRHAAERVITGTARELQHRKSELTNAKHALGPTAQRALQRSATDLERSTRQVVSGTRGHLRFTGRDVESAHEQLRAACSSARFAAMRSELDGDAERLNRRSQRLFAKQGDGLDRLERELELLDPQRVLERGYARIRKGNAVIVDAAGLASGDEIEVELRDGRIQAEVTGNS